MFSTILFHVYCIIYPCFLLDSVVLPLRLYHGSFSLRHWLQQPNWLPTLEATLAFDEESVRRVNYLHCHGIAHTEIRLENVHISPVDRHIKVGILGNAADFYENGPSGSALDSKVDRRQMMIAFDMRCVGFMMAKMVLSELMDPSIFTKFKHFLMTGKDPSCLREFLLPILTQDSATGNVGLQILDRNWVAGWNLLSLLLTVKGSKRISCFLRHPFLCGPRWHVVPSMDIVRWDLGSTAVRITEEYIYRKAQRGRLAHFIELMEMLNPHSRPKKWGSWMNMCVSTATISVLVNGSPSDEFRIARGLRQGCSLSLLLFNLVGELLSLMLTKAVRLGLFRGFQIGSQGNSFELSHLQFADDLLIFCNASVGELKNMRRVFMIFELMSGLQINLTKSILFGINVNDDVISEWAAAIGFLWGESGTKNRIHWVSWETACKPMALGGLGLDGVSLKIWFPRLFTLSKNKEGKIDEFRTVNSSGCFWDIAMRRHLADWEMLQWNELMALFYNFNPTPLIDDSLVWTGEGDGCFSVKSCLKFFLSRVVDCFQWESNVWDGVAPPRIEYFVWQVVHKKIAVKVELIKCGVQGIEDMLCMFCGLAQETVSHLFFSCNMSWGYGLAFYIGGRYIVTAWFSSKFPNLMVSFDSLVGDLALAYSAMCSVKKTLKPVTWSPPPSGFVKANVEGAMDKYWIRTSYYGRVDGDGLVAVDWIKYPLSSTLMFLSLVKDIAEIVADKGFIVCHVVRSVNWEADKFAKLGIG
ncbi:putative plastid-lipid-associated protein 14 [Hibiscus syriacus]|uniref:Plastid-lipid-associated protein 14 n=1 Tax=Hibiscus syriacus TaxID=106335 RepID=A0A6A3CWY2_HIBSY|nr:putative plastid-lipid-associated protein 14 [Hibiscus syriacus]